MQINTSAARLSSVNVVRFWLIPLINESPYFSYIFFLKLLTGILEFIKGTKTSHHGLNNVGYRRATYTFTKGCNIVKWS